MSTEGGKECFRSAGTDAAENPYKIAGPDLVDPAHSSGLDLQDGQGLFCRVSSYSFCEDCIQSDLSKSGHLSPLKIDQDDSNYEFPARMIDKDFNNEVYNSDTSISDNNSDN